MQTMFGYSENVVGRYIDSRSFHQFSIPCAGLSNIKSKSGKVVCSKLYCSW